MWRTENWREETPALLKLAGPLIVNNLSIAGMQFADAVMAGRLGAESLAAVAVGASVWFFGFAMCLGVLMAISPIAARHFGAGNPELIGRYTRQGMYLGIGFGLVLIVLAHFTVQPLLTAVGIDEGFRDLTVGYVLAIIRAHRQSSCSSRFASRQRESAIHAQSCTHRCCRWSAMCF